MYETFLRNRFFFQFGETMAKRKFTEQRRRMRAVERQNPLDARDYRDAFAEFLNGLGVEVEMHWSGDDLEKFEGFKLSYDPVWDRTWYIVNNPYGGHNLELAIESGFDILFGDACWSFHPTIQGYTDYQNTISALLVGNAASVSCRIEGKCEVRAILVGELMDESDMRLLERIAERDFFATNQAVEYADNFNLSIPLKKKLRRMKR